MQRAKNCDFSFSGLQHVIDKIIKQKEKEEEGASPVFSRTRCRCGTAHHGVPRGRENSPCHSVLPAETLVISK